MERDPVEDFILGGRNTDCFFSRTQCTFGIKCKMDVRNLDKFVDG